MKCQYRISEVIAVLIGVASSWAQQPLKINVPYQCMNNMVIMVKHCEQKSDGEYCSLVKGSAQGPLGDEISVPKAKAVAIIGLVCPAQGAGVQAGNGPTTPAYLKEMPAPARILSEIKGKDVEDTGERQMGAFQALNQMIYDMAWGLEHRYVAYADGTKLTPDERRITMAYQTAYADLWHKVTNKEGHVYDHDPALRNEMLKKFFSDNFRAQYFQSNKNAVAEYKAFQDKMYAPPPPPTQASNGMANDAGSVAARRCIESGRAEMDCLGEGMKIGLKDLAGGDIASALGGQAAPAGLRLAGLFTGSGGTNILLNFGQSTVGVGCGPLDPTPFPYEITRAGREISVHVPIGPKPLLLSYRADNVTLTGPAEAMVSGLVPVGGGGGGGGAGQAETQTTTREREVDAGEAQRYAGSDAVHQNGMETYVTETVTTTSQSAPVHRFAPMKPKTERCSIGTMHGQKMFASMGGALTQMLDPTGHTKGPGPPGLRMGGTYSGGGVQIEFRDDSATVDCGEVHIAQPYTVQESSGEISIKIQNGSTPLNLLLQQNGALTGSGTFDVAGRVVTGHNGNEIIYAPRNARCTLSTLNAAK